LDALGTVRVEIYEVQIVSKDADFIPTVHNEVYNARDLDPLKIHSAWFV